MQAEFEMASPSSSNTSRIECLVWFAYWQWGNWVARKEWGEAITSSMGNNLEIGCVCVSFSSPD